MHSSNQPIIVRRGGIYVEKAFPLQVGDQLCMKEVRRIAGQIPNIRELGINEVSKVISFQAVDSGWRINVYYTTGTVGTCVEHPISGKTQLFRRKVDYETLQRIFQNPRVHTGKGYYKAPSVGVKRSASELSSLEEDEETALSNQIAILKPQLELMETQLASIRQRRTEEEQKRARIEREVARKEEAARLVEEKRLRAAAAADQLRVENIARQEAKERLEASNHANNLRGAYFDYRLSFADHFPDSMNDVKCVAICDGGYIAVDDSGSCSWHGIPAEVAEIIERQHNKMIDYVAFGPNQFYIRKTNGKVIFRGCREFEEEIRNEKNGAVKFVTFGDERTYYMKYANGNSSYNYSFADQIPSEVVDKLTSRPVRHFYIGQDTRSRPNSAYNKAYCITYEDGSCDFSNLPRDLDDWFEGEKKPGNKMKQVLADTTGCYFVRYT